MLKRDRVMWRVGRLPAIDKQTRIQNDLSNCNCVKRSNEIIDYLRACSTHGSKG